MRETGMAVSVNMTVIRASQIDQVFGCKSSSAKYSTIRCLLQSNGIVIRSKTYEVQTAPAEKREEAKAWVMTVVPILTQPNCHQDWIANMDQTLVPFTMTPKTTLNEQGSRTSSRNELNLNSHFSNGVDHRSLLMTLVAVQEQQWDNSFWSTFCPWLYTFLNPFQTALLIHPCIVLHSEVGILWVSGVVL